MGGRSLRLKLLAFSGVLEGHFGVHVHLLNLEQLARTRKAMIRMSTDT